MHTILASLEYYNKIPYVEWFTQQKLIAWSSRGHELKSKSDHGEILSEVSFLDLGVGAFCHICVGWKESSYLINFLFHQQPVLLWPHLNLIISRKISRWISMYEYSPSNIIMTPISKVSGNVNIQSVAPTGTVLRN